MPGTVIEPLGGPHLDRPRAQVQVEVEVTLEQLQGEKVTLQSEKYTWIGYKVGPQLREFRILAPSSRRRELHLHPTS